MLDGTGFVNPRDKTPPWVEIPLSAFFVFLEAYRSGHNGAVLNTVEPSREGPGVRIPQLPSLAFITQR